MEYGKLFQFYRQSSARYQIQILGLFLLGLIIASLVSGVYLNITSRAATYGRKIQAMQAEIQENERMNADLESQLARLISASVIEARANELGYVATSQETFAYITVPGYSGRDTAILAPPPGPIQASETRLPSEFTESLIDWFRQLTLRPVTMFASEIAR
jgi:cell division protein FtsB